MLLIASETFRGSQTLNDVAREMSLSLRFFAAADRLTELGDGPWRRIVLLADTDVDAAVVASLKSAASDASAAVIVAAELPQPRSSDRAGLLDELTDRYDLAWIGADFDFERLAAAARGCRRSMLKVSREDLVRAFEDGEFVVQYQPKVERGAGSDWITREAEALVRWQHPGHGMIGPLEFLPEIEEFGMMPDLTDLVLGKAAAQLAEWQSQGLELNGCINLASSQLTDCALVERFAAIVRAAGIACERFTFEVIEQDLAHPEAPHVRTLEGLREQGFRICLDDFRVAAASLAMFDRLPFDEIKIHASAIDNAQQNPVSLHVLAAVTGLAHNLGISVCAEGVENQHTFDFLQMIECDKMQGFLVSEAVLPDIIQRTYSAHEASTEVA